LASGFDFSHPRPAGSKIGTLQELANANQLVFVGTSNPKKDFRKLSRSCIFITTHTFSPRKSLERARQIGVSTGSACFSTAVDTPENPRRWRPPPRSMTVLCGTVSTALLKQADPVETPLPGSFQAFRGEKVCVVIKMQLRLNFLKSFFGFDVPTKQAGGVAQFLEGFQFEPQAAGEKNQIRSKGARTT